MFPLVAGQLPYSLSALFERQKDLVPDVARISEIVGQTYVRHTRLKTTGHGFELRDEVFETEGFTHRLGAGGFTHDVHHVDMKVVVSRLICLS